jgi:hypothetical protein
MGKKIYILFIILLVVGGILVLVQVNQQSKIVQRLAWSNFNTEDEIAFKMSELLKDKIRSENILFLGLEPGDEGHHKIWLNFLKQIKKSDWVVDEIYFEFQLPLVAELWSKANLGMIANVNPIAFDVRKDEKPFIEMLQKNLNSGRKTIVILPNVYSVQILKDNPARRINNTLIKKVFSISLLEVYSESLVCISGDVDYTGQSSLGCAVREKLLQSRLIKNPQKMNYSLTIEEHSAQDFLIFFKK